jgi:nucleoside-diphosphate-sugar epimerase
MHRRTILLTGAAGRIGRVLAAALADRYSLTLTDVRPLSDAHGAPFVLADLGERAQIAPLCRGIDTVVHLAASADLATSWEPLLRNNIIGSHHLFEAASEGGCRRVVFASSIHTVDGYPAGSPIGPGVPPRPQTLYGASKAWGESLAGMHAQRGPHSAICLRLGWVMPGDDALIHLDNERLDIVLTHEDLVRLFVAAIEAPDDLRFGVFFGLSNNRHNRYDLGETRHRLGYAPQDDAFAIAQRREPRAPRSWLRAARRAARRALRG